MGTLLELAFLLQLRQVGHLEPDYPIIAHPFWKPVIEIMNNQMYHQRLAEGNIPLISEKDLESVRFSKEIPEIVGVVSKRYDQWRSAVRDRVRITT